MHFTATFTKDTQQLDKNFIYFLDETSKTKSNASPKKRDFKKSAALTPKSKDFKLKSKIAQKAAALKKSGKTVLDIPDKLLGE